MDLLNDINTLHDKWDAKGGQSGDDKYEEALYDCINELGDVIIRHEKVASLVELHKSLATCPKCSGQYWNIVLDGFSNQFNKMKGFICECGYEIEFEILDVERVKGG